MAKASLKRKKLDACKLICTCKWHTFDCFSSRRTIGSAQTVRLCRYMSLPPTMLTFAYGDVHAWAAFMYHCVQIGPTRAQPRTMSASSPKNDPS